jgi:hypothetical protein
VSGHIKIERKKNVKRKREREDRVSEHIEIERRKRACPERKIKKQEK